MNSKSFLMQDHTADASDQHLVRWLLRFVKPYRSLILLSSVVSLLMAGLQLVGPYLVKITIDVYIANANLGGIARMAAIYLAVIIALLLLEFAQGLVIAYVGQHGMRRLREKLFAHLQMLDVQFFDRNPVGRLLTRVTNDVQALNELFSQGVMTILGDIFLLCAIVGLMVTTSPPLTGLVLLTAPLVLASGYLFSKYVRQAYRDVRQQLSQLNAYLQETLGGIRTVIAYNSQATSYERFCQLNDTFRLANMRTVFCHAIFLPAIELIGAIALALIVWRGGIGTIDQSITIGTVVLFIQYTQRFFQPIKDLSDKYNIFQTAMAAAERLHKLLQTEPQIRSLPSALPKSTFEHAIQFQHVWFSYEPGKWVLRDVSFCVGQGETVAIVGPTGSGKSTIVSLLARFYEVTQGSITLDGYDIRKIKLDDLRRLIAVVSQDVYLFSGTIADNIRLGRPEISLEKVIECARYVNAASFIEKLPGRYNYHIQERGITLSVGQKQLLALARALAFDAPILVLDEATANIDTETERLIQDALTKLLGNRTALVIAHRLSTIRKAKKIIVLQHGEIKESGTHEELIQRDGLYRLLYQLQFLSNESSGTSANERERLSLVNRE
ncbi:MAG: ABC transporter ATP-binding protein/permease [Candidatus Sumerlaeaceae bacterium]|nr:ABC transporter ATP-binding protein/permease [Candidatus Sumerlaeaceae bacterium]